jgi:hypothetical protein
MRRRPDRQERLAGLFVVVGCALVFAPAIWLLQRWSEAVARDPADAWGARWLGEQVTDHPYLTAGVIFLSTVLSSGMIMLIMVSLAKGWRPGSPTVGGHRRREVTRTIPELEGPATHRPQYAAMNT